MIEDIEQVSELCVVCDTSMDRDDMILIYGSDWACVDCSRICDRCEESGTINDSFSTVDGRLIWCESCTSNHAQWCESCMEYGTDGYSYIQDIDQYWCNDCTSSTSYCEYCDTHNSGGCENCENESDENGDRIIHDYNYRPDTIFHSTDKDERLYFGIEIEVEDPRGLRDSSHYAHRLEGMELAYLKQDGSLSCGFEIVTHPMSHDFFKNEADELWDTLENLRTTYKVKSWSTTTCGLHIHISRTGFNGGSHMHRFINLVYSNQELYETLAGRKSTRWASFDDLVWSDFVRDEEGCPVQDEYGYTDTVTKRSIARKLHRGSGSERYSAVNVRNAETLEMRIFRGSVNSRTIKSQIDLAHASVEYTRTLTVKDIRADALSADRFTEYILDHSELYPQLCERLEKLIPSVRLHGQNVSA